MISIHALREESDTNRGNSHNHAIISIHALREESDFFNAEFFKNSFPFLSTPSARRATPPVDNPKFVY